MFISMRSIRAAAAGAMGVGALTGVMLFGAIPEADAAPAPAPATTLRSPDQAAYLTFRKPPRCRRPGGAMAAGAVASGTVALVEAVGAMVAVAGAAVAVAGVAVVGVAAAGAAAGVTAVLVAAVGAPVAASLTTVAVSGRGSEPLRTWGAANLRLPESLVSRPAKGGNPCRSGTCQAGMAPFGALRVAGRPSSRSAMMLSCTSEVPP